MLSAQKIKVVSGNLDQLKGQKEFFILYDYSSMGVGKFEKEEDYLKKKVSDYNKKERGKGDRWKKAWINDREYRFQPKFEQLINKYLKSSKVYVSEENADAKYTMIVKTTFTEPGFNVYVTRKPAVINVIIDIVETKNPENVVVSISSKNNKGTALGMNDMDTGVRITEAYAKCGKEIGKYLSKKAFK
ncbi:MAG: hypothetical protein HN704_02540 [Bacteroidetes bacterium]|nr:hypothetical protein [Bacteroidota bacterium]MBT6686347.1 hypothetical protein [Bacteroidota bacterium]MBT7142180.1 hypothetical protein [Bacteroidota bacterium]MBT7490465.1 hypothetical protein [Bacteroidota bacterium]